MKTVAVIGTGLSSLTAGALLAKVDCKVTVLEQHSINVLLAWLWHMQKYLNIL